MVALTRDATNMGLNLDFDDVGRFGAGKGQEGFATGGAVLGLVASVMNFRHHRQSGPLTAAMALTTGLLAPLAGTRWLGRTHMLGTCALLTFFAVQALLEISDGGLMGSYFCLQSGFALEKPLIESLPVIGLPLELDMGLLGQHHRLLGKRGGVAAVDWRSLGSGVELGDGAFHELRYTRFLRNVLMASD